MEQELKLRLKAEVKDLKTKLQQAEEDLEEFGDKGKEAGEAVDKALEKTKEIAGKAMKAFSAAIVAGTTAMIALVESTREYRTAQAKLNTSFEDTGKSAEAAYETYAELQSVIGETDVAVEAAQQISLLADSEADCAKWAELAAGVVAKFGDALQPETFYEAANETISLGEATGAYTQMLEQAGYDVEKFNEGLAECKTKAEKQAYALKYANEILGAAADKYKAANKELIEANKAQERMTASLAKIGKAFEPVVSELKNMGAEILESLEEPLGDIADVIVGDILPAVRNMAKWVSDNFEKIAGVVAGAAAAYVAYKVAVFAADVATKGLTASVMASATAQKVMNAVINANPFALMVSAMAAVTVGIIAYSALAENAIEATTYLTEAQQEHAEAVREAAEAYSEMKLESQKMGEDLMAEMGIVRSLADTFFSLVDATGRVNEANRTQAEFIINELNEKLGLEIEMVNGVVSGYENLEAAVYAAIEARKAEALMDIYYDDYKAAIQDIPAALQAVSDKEAELVIARQKHQEALDAVTEFEIEMNARRASGYYGANQEIIESDNRKLLGLKNNAAQQGAIVDKIQGEYEAALENYKGLLSDKMLYDAAMLAQQKGDSEEVARLLGVMGDANYQLAADFKAGKQLSVDELRQLSTQTAAEAEFIKWAFENGVDGYTAQMVAEAQAAAAEAEAAFREADTVGAGAAFGEGAAQGIASKVGSIVAAARNLGAAGLGALKGILSIHSPSKITRQYGEFFGEGFTLGIEDEVKEAERAVEKLAQRSLKPIELSAKDFAPGNFSGLSSRPSGLTTPAISAASGSSQWVGALIDGLAANNSPIILQVDGKTFAQTSINTMNSYFKQTGTMPLQIIV